MTTSRDWAEAKADEILDAHASPDWRRNPLSVSNRDTIAAALREERAAATERAIKAGKQACAGWLAAFENHPIKYVSPARYAADAVKDIAEVAEIAIRAASEGKGDGR